MQGGITRRRDLNSPFIFSIFRFMFFSPRAIDGFLLFIKKSFSCRRCFIPLAHPRIFHSRWQWHLINLDEIKFTRNFSSPKLNNQFYPDSARSYLKPSRAHNKFIIECKQILINSIQQHKKGNQRLNLSVHEARTTQKHEMKNLEKKDWNRNLKISIAVDEINKLPRFQTFRALFALLFLICFHQSKLLVCLSGLLSK